MALTPKQEQFCLEYIVDFNGAQAAIRAGYSERTAKSIANENLTKPDIQARVGELMKQRQSKAQVTGEMVLAELAKIGFSNIKNVAEWTAADGVGVKGSNEIDDEVAAAISEVSEGKFGIKVKLHDKKGALELLGRHFGLFTDKVEHSADESFIEVIRALTGNSQKRDKDIEDQPELTGQVR